MIRTHIWAVLKDECWFTRLGLVLRVCLHVGLAFCMFSWFILDYFVWLSCHSVSQKLYNIWTVSFKFLCTMLLQHDEFYCPSFKLLNKCSDVICDIFVHILPRILLFLYMGYISAGFLLINHTSTRLFDLAVPLCTPSRTVFFF